MTRKPKMHTQELGLILGSRLLPGGDLHYGYWEGLEPTWGHIAQAQQAYTDFLLSHIPAGVSTILDVGMGTGRLSETLLAKGYRVEGVSPSAALSELAQERLGPNYTIHRCGFEDVPADRPVELVLFSESFQYIPLRHSLPKAAALLAPGGYVLICDFFKTEAPGRGPVGGGHRLTRFYRKLAEHPFEIVTDLDITAYTAPTIELYGRAMREQVRPVLETLAEFVQRNHPWVAAAVAWALRNKLRKWRKTFLSDRLGAAGFAEHCSYRLILLRRR